MEFINHTKNTIYLHEIDKYIPYINNDAQFISSDDIKKSSFFQNLCIQKKIEITEICDDRMEQNLLNIQKNGIKNVKQDDVKVCIKGHFYNNTGYGKSNRNLLLGLLRSGCNIGIQPVNKQINGLNEIEVNSLDALCRDSSDDSILIDSTIPTFLEASKSRYSILYTTVESSSLSRDFINACNTYDEIWTTSDFCKNTLEKYGALKPIFVIPNAVNHNLYKTGVQPFQIEPGLKDFVFLSVFDWNYRKGYDALIKSYLRAFNGHDNVSLLIVSKYKNDNSGECKIGHEIKDMIKKYGGDNPASIARCGNHIAEFEMPNLYSACDAFILPSRGEGFGLPFIEASLCGLPIISTNHSGHTMFLNNSNSSLADIDCLCTSNKMNVHYWDGELFPDLTSDEFISSLSYLMKDVYINYADALSKNEYLRTDILSKYTIGMVGLKAKMRLDEIISNLEKK